MPRHLRPHLPRGGERVEVRPHEELVLFEKGRGGVEEALLAVEVVVVPVVAVRDAWRQTVKRQSQTSLSTVGNCAVMQRDNLLNHLYSFTSK